MLTGNAKRDDNGLLGYCCGAQYSIIHLCNYYKPVISKQRTLDARF